MSHARGVKGYPVWSFRVQVYQLSPHQKQPETVQSAKRINALISIVPRNAE